MLVILSWLYVHMEELMMTLSRLSQLHLQTRVKKWLMCDLDSDHRCKSGLWLEDVLGFLTKAVPEGSMFEIPLCIWSIPWFLSFPTVSSSLLQWHVISGVLLLSICIQVANSSGFFLYWFRESSVSLSQELGGLRLLQVTSWWSFSQHLTTMLLWCDLADTFRRSSIRKC